MWRLMLLLWTWDPYLRRSTPSCVGPRFPLSLPFLRSPFGNAGKGAQLPAKGERARVPRRRTRSRSAPDVPTGTGGVPGGRPSACVSSAPTPVRRCARRPRERIARSPPFGSSRSCSRSRGLGSSMSAALLIRTDLAIWESASRPARSAPGPRSRARSLHTPRRGPAAAASTAPACRRLSASPRSARKIVGAPRQCAAVGWSERRSEAPASHVCRDGAKIN